MRGIYTLVIVSILIVNTTLAQFSPASVAKFGIDGDILSGLNQNGNFSSGGTHDWFKKSGGGANVGIGIIDTSGASVLQTRIAQGENFQFSRGMAYPLYSVQDGYLLLDTRYARDNFGYANSPGKSDSTTFTNGSKNGDNPSIWSTTPNGSTVADKVDIIDAYIHMRRNGTTINNTNPSPLMLMLGLSTVGNTGDRFIDFELFRSRVNYNTTTGVFSNTGPNAFGGHSIWQFNANGSVRELGDMTVSFSFGTGGVQNISVYIWVSLTDYNTVNPSNFSFVANEFYGAGQNSSYGYAKIVPKGANQFNAWASYSTALTTGPVWGTNSKSLGSSPANYFSPSYGALDFAEAAIDLTSMGIDPALSQGADPCVPPFTRVIAKTRSSSSFTSALQDFIGPYEFLDAPTAPANIAPPQTLRCNRTSVTLSPATTVSGAVYNWSTTNGNIVSNTNSPTITVDKGGKYYLSASIVAGCPTNIDSTIVGEDYYKPVASASSTGVINLSDPLSTANIWGGDVAASNFNTPYGGSAGLDWKWTGPNNYISTARNNVINLPGTYNLELTETRNGCKDFAQTSVSTFQTLPVKITDFTAVKKEADQVSLKWTTAEEVPKQIELQRSFSGNEFTTIAYFLPESSLGLKQSFSYDDNVRGRASNKIYYRIKISETGGAVKYSWIVSVSYNSDAVVSNMGVAPNPARNYTVVSTKSEQASTSILQIVDMSGKIMLSKNIRIEKGVNQVSLEEVSKLQNGMYIIRVITNNQILTQKLIKENN